MFKFKFKSIAPPSQNPSTKIRQNPYRLYDNPKWTDFVVIDENREGIFRFPGVSPLQKAPSKDFSYIFIPYGNYLYNVIPSNDIKEYILHNLYFKTIPDNDIFDVNIPYSNFKFAQLPEGELNYLPLVDSNLRYRLLVNDLQQTLIPLDNLDYFDLSPSDLRQGLIPHSNFEYFKLISDLNYSDLFFNDLRSLILQNQTLGYNNIPINDLNKETTDLDNILHGLIPLTDFLPVNIPLNNESYIFIPQSKISYSFLSSINEYNYIPPIDNINLFIPNIISRYTSLLNNDLSYSMLEPEPPPPPTFYVTGGGTSHVFNAQGGIVWNGYGSNYLSVGFSQEGESVPPQAGWYFVDDVGTIRQLLNDVLWFSGGAPSPFPNGAGWLAVSNGPFALNESNTTLTFYEQQPTVTFGTP